MRVATRSKFILSICIPTFNRSAYLESTIESIVNQALFRDRMYVEIVVSDNASSDATANICQDYL